MTGVNSAEIKKYTYKSGAVYEGSFDGSMRSGLGHWVHPNGEVYEGEYKENKQNGLGVYAFPDTGKRYLGNWSNGQMSGEGLYYFNGEQSAYYFGGYLNDKKHGKGHYHYENGAVTTQQWDMGNLISEQEAGPVEVVEIALQVKDFVDKVRAVAPRLLGERPPPSEVRTFQFPSGATYTGQYFGTKKHGLGYWMHPEGDSYEGQFELNKHNGWGVYVIGRSGKKYVGQWKDGKMNGAGVYFFNPQETEYFVGMYQDDVKNGRGMYHFAETNSSKTQRWECGVLKQETDTDEEMEQEYIAAVKAIIAAVKPFSPMYEPVGFTS